MQRMCADLPQNQADSRCRPIAATLSAARKNAQGRRCIAATFQSSSIVPFARRFVQAAAWSCLPNAHVRFASQLFRQHHHERCDQTCGDPRPRALDRQRRQREAVHVREICCRPEQRRRHHPIRARLVHGVATDLRLASRRPAGFLGHGLVARRGFDCWCVDMEGYGRSTKDRDNNAPIAQGADDCLAAATYIQRLRGKRPLLVYGISSGALRAALFAQRHPQLVARLALDAMVWTGEGSPTLAERKKKLPEFKAKNRRPIDKAFIHSIFDRDHPGTAEEKVIDAFADAVTALNSSVPTGTYVDMCSKLPVVDPEKIAAPTLVMRGQWDGIASFEDLLAFYARLPNPDKHFAVMPGISHASFQQKNYALVYHILWSFFTQPAPIYSG